jgi:hypothetical protein
LGSRRRRVEEGGRFVEQGAAVTSPGAHYPHGAYAAQSVDAWTYRYWQIVLADIDGWRERSVTAQSDALASATCQSRATRMWRSDRVYSLRG